MSKKVRNEQVISLAKKGQTLESIGLKFGISKQRVRQIVSKEKINPLKIRQNKRNEVLKNIPNDLSNGISVTKIRSKYKLKHYEIKKLYQNGVDVRLVKFDEIEKECKVCDKLYKKGLTAYEIIDIYPKINNITKVYNNVCKVNGGHLPKRINTRTKKSMQLKNKILNLKINNTFEEVHSILVKNGVKNLNGGPLKLESIKLHYYNALK